LHRPTVAPFTSIDPRSRLFCAFDDDQPDVAIGALVGDRLDQVPPSADDVAGFRLDRFLELFEARAIGVLRWAGVDPAHRRGTTLTALLAHAHQTSLDEGVEIVLLDCSPYLVGYYEQFGARRYAPHFVYPYTGILTVPMVAPLSDIEHHRAMGSVLTDLLAAVRPHRPDVHDWLIAEFGPYERRAATTPGTASPVRPPDRCGIFDILPEGAYEQFLARAPMVQLSAGDAALRAGDTGRRELRIVLHGYFEVLASAVGRPPAPVATLGPGEPIGEISTLLGVPATADVNALTDATVAVLDLDQLSGSAAADPPAISDAERALLWQAISTMLAERVRRTTLWVSPPPLR
jgi:hypothetical protein